MFFKVLKEDTHCRGRFIAYLDHKIQVYYKHDLLCLASLFRCLGSFLPVKAAFHSLQSTLATTFIILERLNLPPPLAQFIFTPLRPFYLARVLALSSVLVVACASTESQALPSGYEAKLGNVRFEQTGSKLDVSSTSTKSIVHYRDFSIGQGEAVNFNLPNEKSAILNRVTGNNPSEIMGAMRSNGQVFLVNPNGVVFGATSQVNVSGLVASTLNIRDEDFAQGKYIFRASSTAAPAAVKNAGTIETTPGGFAVLTGSAVENTGTITSEKGQVSLAVGERVNVTVADNLDIQVKVDAALKRKVSGARDAIANSGSIHTKGGKTEALARLENSLYERAINNEGIITAQGFETVNGEIVFFSNTGSDAIVRNAGTMDASGTTASPDGGKVAITGDYVVQRGKVLAEAAENGQGGEIRVSSVKGTKLTGGSVTSARGAGNNSDAGTIIIWSDNNTYFDRGGVLDVSGGSVSGDASFVEISGKESVFFEGRAFGSANNGKSGTIYIDPQDITINDSGGSAPSRNDAVLPDENFTDHGITTDVVFDPRYNGGSGVFVGFGNIWLQANRNIIVSSAFDTSIASTGAGGTPVSLTLDANASIFIQAAITTHNADITLRGNADGVGAGSVNINFGGSLTSNNGNINIYGTNVTLQGAVNAGTGTVTINTTAGGTGDIILAANLSGDTVNMSANGSGNYVRTAGTITANSITLQAGTGTIGAAATANRIYTNTANLSATTLGAGNVFITETDGVTLGNSTAGTTFDLQASDIILPGGVTISSGVVNLTADTLDLSGSINAPGGTVTLRPLTASTSIGLAGGTGTFNLTNAEMLNVTANRLVIGGISGTPTAGNMEIGAIDFAATNKAMSLELNTSGLIIDASAGSEVANIKLAANQNLTIDGSTGGGSGRIGNSGVDEDLDIELSGTGHVSLDTDNADIYLHAFGNLIINAMTPGTGNINVVSTGTIMDTSGASAITSSGTVNLQAAGTIGTLANPLNMNTSGALTITGPSDIILSNANNTLINSITSSGGGNINLSSGGTINDTDDVGANISTTGNLSLTSGGAIGAANAQGLNILANWITVTDTSGGSVRLYEDDAAMRIASISTGGLGAVTLTTTGLLEDSGATTAITTSDTITLQTNGAIGSAGNVFNISAGNGVSVTGTNGNDIYLTHNGAFRITSITTGAGLSGDIYLTGVSLAESDAVEDSTANVTTTGRIFLTATGGNIGSASNELDVNAGTGLAALTASATSGSIYIEDTAGTLDIGNLWASTATGTASIRSGNLTIPVATSIRGLHVIINSDTPILNGMVEAGASGTATFRPSTNGATIGLGGALGTLTLSNTDISAAHVTAGTLIIGSTTSGNITIDALDLLTENPGVHLSLISGQNIIDGSAGEAANILMGANRNVAFTSTGGTVGGAAAADIDLLTSGTGTLSITTSNGAATVETLGAMIIGAISTGTGNLDLTSASTIDDTGAAVAITNTGTIRLTSNGAIGGGAGGPLNINVGNITVASTNGNNISLSETGPMTIAAITTGGAGNISLTSTSSIDDTGAMPAIVTTGSLTLASGSAIGSGAGGSLSVNVGTLNVTSSGGTNIAIDETGPMTIGSIATGGAGNITLVSTATIDDGNDAGDNIVTTGTLSLTSNGVIGGANAQGLNINTGHVSVTSSGGNHITITDSGALTVTSVSTGGAGNITLQGTSINDTDAVDDANANIVTTGNVILTATTGSIGTSANELDIDAGAGVNAIIASATSGNVYIEETAGAVSFGNVTASAATGMLQVKSPDLTLPALTNFQGANITLIVDNLDVSNSANLNAGTGAVNFQTRTITRAMDLGTATGTGLNISDAELARVTAGTIVLGSDTYQGTLNFGAIDLSQENVHLTINTTGVITDVSVGESANIILGNNRNLTFTGGGGSGTGQIGAAAPADDDLDVTLGTAGNEGFLAVKTNNAGAYIETTGAFIFDLIDVGSAAIGIKGTRIDDRDDGAPNLIAGNVTLESTSGAIGGATAQGINLNVGNITVAGTGGNNITLQETGPMTIASITTGGAGNVTLNSTSTIDDTGAGTAITTTGSLTLTSNGAIGAGAGGALDLNVGTITVTSSGGNAIHLSETGPMTIGAITTGGAGNISLASTSTIDDVDDIGDNIVTTGTLTLTSNGAIGSATAEGININTGHVTVTSSGGNDISITDSGAMTVASVLTGGGGDITLKGTSIMDTDGADDGIANIATTGNVILTATTGSIGTSANELDVNAGAGVNALRATASSGNIYLEETAGPISLGDITANAATGIVRLKSTGVVIPALSTVQGNNITITADALTVNGLVNAGATGDVIYQPLTTGGTIGLGGAAGTLSIANASLAAANLVARNLIIGNASVGNISIDSLDLAAGNPNVNLVLITGQGILDASGGESPNITLGNNRNLAMTSGAAIGGVGAADLDIQTGGTGHITITTTNSDVFLDAASNLIVSSIATGSGNISLSASGTIDDTGAGVAITNTGTLTLASNGAIGMGAGGALGITTGNITITGTGGNHINLSETGPMTIADINTAGAGNITLTSTSTIDDTGAGDNITTSGSLTLTSNGAIGGGAGGALGLNVGNITVTSSGGSAITLETSGAMTIADIATGGAGNIILIAGTTIDDTGAGDNITTTGTLTLTSNGAIGSGAGGPLGINTGHITITSSGGNDVSLSETGPMTIADINTGGAGNILLISSSTIDDTGAGDNITTTGSLTLTSNGAIGGGAGGALGLNVGTINVISSGGNHITLQESGAMTIGDINTGGAGNILLISASTIDDTGAGDNITTTGTLTLTSNGAIGSGLGGVLGLNVGNITITTSGGNDIALEETGNMTITSIQTGGAGDIYLAATGSITDTDDVGNNIVTAGRLDLLAGSHIGTAGNHLQTAVNTLSANSTGGHVYLAEADAVSIDASSGGTFQLRSPNAVTVIGDITAQNLILTTTANHADILFNADATGATSATITAHGTGNILSGGGRIIGSTVTLASSGGNIGQSGNALLTDAGTLQATTSGAGDIVLSELNSITLAATSAGGDFALDASGAIQTSGIITATDISLSTTAGNSGIQLGDDLSATTVSLNTHGDGDITQSGGVINATTLAIASTTGDISLDTNISNLSGATGGNITLVEANGLNISGGNLAGADIHLTTTLGDVTLTGHITGENITINSAGSILDDGDAQAVDLIASESVSLTAGGSVGTALNALEAQVSGSGLSVTDAGNIWLTAATGDLTLGAINTTAGNILITSLGGHDIILTDDLTAANGIINLNLDGDLRDAAAAEKTLSAQTIHITTTGVLEAPRINLVADTLSSGDINLNIGSFAGFGIHDITGNSLTGNLINAGNLDIVSTGAISLGSIDLASFGLTDLRLQANNAIQLDGTITVPGNITLVSTTGAINLDTVGSASTITAQNMTIDAENASGIHIRNAATLLRATGGGAALNLFDDDPMTAEGGINPGDTINAVAGSGGVINIDGDFASIGTVRAEGGGSDIIINYSNGNLVLDNVTLDTSAAVADGTINITNDTSVGNNGTLDAVSGVGANEIKITVTGGFGVFGSNVNMDTSSIEISSDDAITLEGAFNGAAMTLSSANAGINLTESSGNLSVTSAIAAGSVDIQTQNGSLTAGTVTTGDTLNLQATGGNLAVTSATSGGTMRLISDGTVIAGTLDSAGTLDIQAGSDLTITTAGAIGDMTLVAGGNANLDTLDTDGALDIQANGGSLAITSATADGNLSLFADAGLTVGAATTLGEIVIQSATGNMSLGSVQAVDAVTLNSGGAVTFDSLESTNAGDITITAGSTIMDTDDVGSNIRTDGTLILTSNGNIGTLGNRIQTAVGTLQASNNGIGGIFIQDADALMLGPVSAGGSVNISAGDTLTVGNTITGQDITLATTSNNGAILIGADVTAANAISLTAHGSGDINQTAGLLTTNSLAFASSSGNINLNTDIQTVSGTTTGNITLTEADTLTVGSAGMSGHSIDIHVASGNLAVDGAMAANHLQLATSNGNIHLNSNVTGNTIEVQAGGTGNIALNGNLNGNAIQLSTATSGNISGNGLIIGGNLHVASGTGNVDIQTRVTRLTGSTAGNITVNETDGLTIGSDGLTGRAVRVTGQSGNVTLAGAVTGHRVWITSAGSILDGNGSATDIIAAQGATLRAQGTIGLLSNPLEVAVANGLLRVGAEGLYRGVSVNINGTVSPGDTLTITNDPPGRVIFNGVDLILPPSPAPSPGPSPSPSPGEAPTQPNGDIQQGQYYTVANNRGELDPTYAENVAVEGNPLSSGSEKLTGDAIATELETSENGATNIVLSSMRVGDDDEEKQKRRKKRQTSPEQIVPVNLRKQDTQAR